MAESIAASHSAKRSGLTSGHRWLLLSIGAIALSLYSTGIGQQELWNAGGLRQLSQFLTAAVHPDLSSEFLGVVVRASGITLGYAVCGTCLSLVLGSVGGLLCSEIWWKTLLPRRASSARLWWGMRALLSVPRAIHELIWGLFLINVFGLDPLVAILAIAIPFGAIVAKVFSEILDETPRQPLNALLSHGVSPLTALLYGLLPEAFLNLVSYSFYRFECSLRSAAVLGIIGAGGLGYEMLLSLQSLRYQQLWTLFGALFVLNGLVDLTSAIVRRRLGSPSRLDLNMRQRQPLRRPVRQRDPVLVAIVLGLVLLIPVSFVSIGADFSKLWSPRSMALLSDIGHSALPPRLSAAALPDLVSLSGQTVAMSVLAIAVAGLGGVLLSFPAAYNLFLPGGLLNPNRTNRWGALLSWSGVLASRAVLLFCRAIPAPIWALVALFVLFPGILPGAIALGLHNLGILGRLMAEVTENLDQRPLKALRSHGSPASLVFLYGIMPLTLTRFLAYILYRWEVCMRETVIVGLVGAGGLGRLLTEQMSSFDYQSIVVTLGCFVVLTFAIDWVSGSMRRSLR